MLCGYYLKSTGSDCSANALDARPDSAQVIVLFKDDDLEAMTDEMSSRRDSGQTSTDDCDATSRTVDRSDGTRSRRSKDFGDEGLNANVDDGEDESEEMSRQEKQKRVAGRGESHFGREVAVRDVVVILRFVDLRTALWLIRTCVSGRRTCPVSCVRLISSSEL